VRFHLTLSAAMAATLALTLPATAQAPRPMSTVTVGEGGSHILGNPGAAVKVTEYVSYTCPACARFSAEGGTTLKNSYVAGGRVSTEIRHLVRDPIDLAMAVAAHCGAPARFFSRHEALMAEQAAILQRVQALPEATRQGWATGPVEQRLARLARDAGVTAWMERRGFTADQITRCMADRPLQERLIAMSNAARALGVHGTPSFAINGTLLDEVHSWSGLRPRLDAALAASR
jgi:protein-disulfide isomerase